MATSHRESSSDPAAHCENLGRQLGEVANHLRQDVARVDDPQFKALCETSAEVVDALRTSFRHYAAQSEPAWRPAKNGSTKPVRSVWESRTLSPH